MAGGPAYLLLRPVSPVRPVSAFKSRRRILTQLPKSTWKFRISPQSPRENPLFAQKTHELSDRVRHPQTKIQGAIEDLRARAEAEDLPARTEAALPYIVGKLVDFIANEGKVLIEVHDDLKWIKKQLEYMQCFLEDAYSKQMTDEKVGKLVAEIRDVSYEVEDAIDTFIYSQQRRRGFIGNTRRHFMEPKTHDEVAKQIKVIKQKISDISRRRETYGIRDINEGRPESSLQIRRRFLALLEDPEVVGLKDEIKKVKELLNDEEPSRRVVSIFGIGGSGKTTLAKKVYNAVKDGFDCHAFICISQRYEIRDVQMRIIECVMGTSVEEKLEVEDLRKKLADHLREKRYLVVFDDVWDVEAWDTLKHVLPDGMKKNRVILTTHNEEVALHAGTSSPHQKIDKRLLGGNEAWELFLKTVFQGENPPTACLTELHETGTKIFAKCGGLPLVILVLASLLSRKRISAWSKVLETEYPHLTESPEEYMGILGLSYWDLPAHLKPCFLYLGLFPEDYEIDSEKLIRLWIAEGFIQQRDDDTMEDVAEEYLEELVDRSMVQASRKRPDGPVVKCRIHDLLRRLSISKAKQNKFFTIHNDDGTSSISTSSRRLALHRNIERYHPTAALRSILSFWNSDVSHSEFSQAKLLRVVSQDYMPTLTVATLTEEVREFVLLRYLELSKSQSLPSSIGDLYNLQTLILNQSYSPLPKAVSNLKQLRHLEAPNSYVEDFSINKLTNLQTLRLRAGNWIEHGFGKLTNLRKLEITGNTDPYNKALSDSIDKLKNLRSLSLDRWSYHPLFMPFRGHLHLYQMSLIGRMKKLPELPPNLAELSLARCNLDQDAISILEKLPHLQILILGRNSYGSKKMICSSGGFPQLETLTLCELPLEEWIVEEGAMPSLNSVILCNMDNLNPQTLPKRIRDMLKLV